MPGGASSGLADKARGIASPILHSVVRNGRRVRGRAQLERITVSGVAPNAVIAALKKATVGRPSPEEKAWINRIEIMRALLGSSPQELEVVDFGAGLGSEFDTGERATRHSSTRTLAQTTKFSKPPRWAYLLFRLVRELRPESAVELGACVGISAAYLASAMELNGVGRVATLEGSDVLARRSERTLEELLLASRAEVREGRFDDTLSATVDDLKPVGLAFIDGHHIESATIDYLNAIVPSAADEAVLVFDDINWSDGMRRAWQTVVDDDRFALTVDLRSVGLAAISKSATSRSHLAVSYY